MAEADRKDLVGRVVDACERLASQDGPYAGVAAAALRVALDHPGDLVDLDRALTLPGAGPLIVLCLDGAAVLCSESADAVELRRGGSCLVSAADGPVRAEGRARLALAAPGTLSAR